MILVLIENFLLWWIYTCIIRNSMWKNVRISPISLCLLLPFFFFLFWFLFLFFFFIAAHLLCNIRPVKSSFDTNLIDGIVGWCWVLCKWTWVWRFILFCFSNICWISKLGMRSNRNFAHTIDSFKWCSLEKWC